jgi:hypothetical protein
MIRLIELNHTLTKVGTSALAVTRRTTPLRSRSLCQLLRGAIWMLAGQIDEVDTPARREACRQLHIETVTLLAELEATLRDPTPANYSGVQHRARAWNDLLERIRPTLGIVLWTPRPRSPLPVGMPVRLAVGVAAAAAEPPRPPARPTGLAPRPGGVFT